MQEDINQEITFRKLSVFMMFMAKGNIARTAEAMKLSSVSVHRALHTLEEGVGCPLFVHKGRNLLPLQAAWTLLEYCQDVISLMNRGLEATRKVAGVGQGRLRIGTLYSLTLETVPRIIMGMKLRRPELELDLTMGSNQMLLDMLEDDALDAILIATNEGEFNNTAFDVVPLFEDDIFLAAPATERLDASRLADLRDYADRKFVSLAEGFATYAGFREAFHIAGFEPEIVTRGFVYVKESEELLQELRDIAQNAVDGMSARRRKDQGEVCKTVRAAVSSYLFKHTKRSPMVIPMVTML